MSEAGDITTYLEAWRAGKREAADKIIEKVYPDLKRLAIARLKSERRNHTLTPTALVHEFYLKFARSRPISIENRARFFALAAQNLRRILVDYAKKTKKGLRVTLDEGLVHSERRDEELLLIDELLNQLQELDPRAAQVIELRFFGGLNEQEVAYVLDVSKITVQRDWKTARAWLMTRLKSPKA